MTSICFDADVTFLPAGAGAIARTVGDRLRETTSVLDFIPPSLHSAILDYSSTADVSAYIQSAVDAVYARGGGLIEFPHGMFNVSGVFLKNGVGLAGKGAPGTFGYANNPPTRKTVFQAVTSGWMVELPDSSAVTAGVVGIDFRGRGAAVGAKGVRIGVGTYWCFIKNCQFDNFSSQAFVLAGLVAVAEDILITNCLLTTPTAKTGLYEISGTDNYCDRVESAGSSGTVTHASNLYVCAAAVTGHNNTFHNCIAETADVGFHVTGHWNKFTGSRADLNWGHGWEISGHSNMFAASHSHCNGKATTNTYDNVIVSGFANSFAAFQSTLIGAPIPRYSLRDTMNGDNHKNVYGSECQWGMDYGTATFNLNEFAGGAMQVPNGPRKTFAALDATPSVLHYGRFITANVSATTIADFDDALPGQEIWVLCNDANTTVQSGTNIFTANRATKKLVGGQWYGFVYESGTWYEIACDQAFRASATYDPPNIAGPGQASTTVAVPGAALGDAATATFSLDLQLVELSAYVSAADTVTCLFKNGTAGAIDLGSGMLKVAVRPG